MSTTRSRLNPLEAALVDEYLIDQDPRQAAIRAGYSKHTTSRQAVALITHPIMRQAIQEAMDARSKRTLITADTVLLDIQTVVARCMQDAPIYDKRTGRPVMVKTRDGTLAPAYRFDAAGALKGLELLGKHLKLFADQIDISGTITHKHTVQDNLKVLGLSEFLELAQQREPVATMGEKPGRLADLGASGGVALLRGGVEEGQDGGESDSSEQALRH